MLNSANNYYTTLPNSTDCDSVICLTRIEKLQPQLCMISVDVNNHNEVVWKHWEGDAMYNIYREGIQSGQYDLVATMEPNNQNRWIDTASDAKMHSYRYKISAIDTCGNESSLSEAHKTMHLTINAGQNNSWNLIWTAYEGTAYSTYNIYRATEDTLGAFTLIGTMPSGNTSFSDFTAPAGYVYYMVEIILNEPCVLTTSLSSIHSNIASNNPNVGIAETLRATSSLRVYPNPTNGQLHITMGHAPLWENAKYVIYNVVGQVVMQNTPLNPP